MSYTFGLLLYSMVSRITDKDFLLEVTQKSCTQLKCRDSTCKLMYSMLTTAMSLDSIHDEVIRLINLYSTENEANVAALIDKLNLK